MNKLTIRRQASLHGNIYFKYVGEITEDEAMDFQFKAGFHPSGYGFYEYKTERGTTTWCCLNSCD
tara:strand:- start:842 stop:1036 length:195 start_codon:yes stop_codon:yes gene_type:complete